MSNRTTSADCRTHRANFSVGGYRRDASAASTEPKLGKAAILLLSDSDGEREIIDVAPATALSISTETNARHRNVQLTCSINSAKFDYNSPVDWKRRKLSQVTSMNLAQRVTNIFACRERCVTWAMFGTTRWFPTKWTRHAPWANQSGQSRAVVASVGTTFRKRL